MKLRWSVVLGMVLAAAAMRVLPHPYNFAPITAMALFGGARFANKLSAWLVPFAAMVLSDLFIGFHDQMWGVYGSFALIVGIGIWLQKHRSIGALTGAVLGSSVLFFFLSNLGVWFAGGLYPRTGQGLVACYIAAIPFFQQSLLGDLFYSTVLFGGLALVERLIPSLREATAGAPTACAS